MNGSLDSETRDNLVRSHAASKVSRYLSSIETPEANFKCVDQSLLFTINDLLVCILYLIR